MNVARQFHVGRFADLRLALSSVDDKALVAQGGGCSPPSTWSDQRPSIPRSPVVGFHYGNSWVRKELFPPDSCLTSFPPEGGPLAPQAPFEKGPNLPPTRAPAASGPSGSSGKGSRCSWLCEVPWCIEASQRASFHHKWRSDLHIVESISWTEDLYKERLDRPFRISWTVLYILEAAGPPQWRPSNGWTKWRTH